MDNLTKKQIQAEREMFEATMFKMNLTDFERNSSDSYINTTIEAFWLGWLMRATAVLPESVTNDMCEAGEAMIYNGGHCDCGNPCEVDSVDVYNSMRRVAKNENKIEGNEEVLSECSRKTQKLMRESV